MSAAFSAAAPEKLEFRFVGAGGGVRWLSLRVMPDAECLRGTVTEITSYKRVEEEFERFVQAAGHDLQEPVRSLSNFAQLLTREWKDSAPGDAAQYLQFIADGAARMRAMVDGLLALSRVSRPVVAEVDCNALLEEFRLAARIESAGLPTLRGDREQLRQLFANLISNSLRFRDPARELRIEISAAAEPDATWVFRVQDNGSGFDAAHAEAVFAPFRRLHARDVAGVGLGLTLCRKIVENHGGRIWAESSQGQGTVVSFMLPREPTA